MPTAGALVAASAHDGRPISGRCDLNEDGAFAQALAHDVQRCLRDAHVTAGPLAFGFQHPMKVHPRGCVMESMRKRIETHGPLGAYLRREIGRASCRERV